MQQPETVRRTQDHHHHHFGWLWLCFIKFVYDCRTERIVAKTLNLCIGGKGAVPATTNNESYSSEHPPPLARSNNNGASIDLPAM